MRARLALAGLAAIALLTACPPPPGTPPPVHGLVGDSISWQLENEGGVLGYRYIDASRGRTAFNGGFSGEPGNGIDGARRVGTAVPAKAWVVIEIGTNDVTNDPASYPWRIQALLNAVPKDRCVAFVTVRRRNYVSRSNEWNRVVRQRIVDHPCRRVIDWDAAVKANPGLLAADGIHYSKTGNAWFRLLLIQTSRLGFGAHPS